LILITEHQSCNHQQYNKNNATKKGTLYLFKELLFKEPESLLSDLLNNYRVLIKNENEIIHSLIYTYAHLEMTITRKQQSPNNNK